MPGFFAGMVTALVNFAQMQGDVLWSPPPHGYPAECGGPGMLSSPQEASLQLAFPSGSVSEALMERRPQRQMDESPAPRKHDLR